MVVWETAYIYRCSYTQNSQSGSQVINPRHLGPGNQTGYRPKSLYTKHTPTHTHLFLCLLSLTREPFWMRNVMRDWFSSSEPSQTWILAGLQRAACSSTNWRTLGCRLPRGMLLGNDILNHVCCCKLEPANYRMGEKLCSNVPSQVLQDADQRVQLANCVNHRDTTYLIAS